MEYLVTYDVETVTPQGQRRLRRVAKVCEGYGIRVQKSVFEIVCTRAQFPKLRQFLLGEIDQRRDSIRIYKLVEGTLAQVDGLGCAQVIAHHDDHII